MDGNGAVKSVALWDEQRMLLRTLREVIGSELAKNDGITAVWLSGSLGRGEGDALSDLDVILIAAPYRIQGIKEQLASIVSVAAPVALIHDAPQNAPLEGAQLNVLYDTNPLPVYVDWNLWPTVSCRPNDVSVLYEEQALDECESATFESILNQFERGRGFKGSEESLNRFRVFMVPILAKHAARGWFDSVNQMMLYMRLDVPAVKDLSTAIDFANRVLNEFGQSESELAKACIRRYLDTCARIDGHSS